MRLGRTIIVGILSLGFFVHFFFVLNFIGPQHPFSHVVKGVVESYINPLFTQNWRLFAPEPSLSDFKFWYRCQDATSGWGPWIDPGASLLAKHKENRLSYRGKLLYIYNNIGTGLYNKAVMTANRTQCQNIDENCETKIMDEITKTQEYTLARRYTSDLCLSQAAMTGNKVKAVEFRSVEIPVKPFSDRKITNLHPKKKFFNYSVAMIANGE